MKSDELIASVFVNRLKLKILLQCDPTVIYALEKANRYQGRLTHADLKFNSPYNTYRYPGLPPGPIANPGMRSLEAVMRPASTRYLYFVRTTGGRHTFSEELAAHNRAVRRIPCDDKRAINRRVIERPGFCDIRRSGLPLIFAGKNGV